MKIKRLSFTIANGSDTVGIQISFQRKQMERIEVVTNESHDWVIVRKGKIVLHEAHDISIVDFCWILKELGHDVHDIEITDKQMERMEK